jgi:hypothetical protein
MTTCFGDSSSDVSYYLRPSNTMSTSAVTKASAPTVAKASTPAVAEASTPAVAKASTPAVAKASAPTTSISPIPSSQLLEGFEDEIRTFSGIAGLRSNVKTLSKQLYEDKTTNQYLVFRPVTEDDLAKIEDQRHTIGRGIRLTHCTDIDTLIIKVPTPEHEAATCTFSYDFMDKVRQIGLTERRDFKAMGATTYRGTSTSKEADACFKPVAFRPNRLDWPTLVFEVGVSESLRKLRNDARWWLANSGGLVRIVLIFHINRGSRTILIKKWECTPATITPANRSNRPPAQIPTQIQTITIDQNGVAGTLPFVLHFQKLLLRQPIPPEQDVTYTAQDFQSLANDMWAALL